MRPTFPDSCGLRLLAAATSLAEAAAERRRAILGLTAEADVVLSILCPGQRMSPASIAESGALSTEATAGALRELACRGYVRRTDQGYAVTPQGLDAMTAAGLRLESSESLRPLRGELASIIRLLDPRRQTPPA